MGLRLEVMDHKRFGVHGQRSIDSSVLEHRTNSLARSPFIFGESAITIGVHPSKRLASFLVDRILNLCRLASDQRAAHFHHGLGEQFGRSQKAVSVLVELRELGVLRTIPLVEADLPVTVFVSRQVLGRQAWCETRLAR